MATGLTIREEEIQKMKTKIEQKAREAKEVIEQWESGLVTADEMAHKIIPEMYEILSICSSRGGMEF